MVERKEMVFPATILAAEATVDPGEAIPVNLTDTQGTGAGEQFLVNPQRVAVDMVAFLKKFLGYFDEPNSITDP